MHAVVRRVRPRASEAAAAAGLRVGETGHTVGMTDIEEPTPPAPIPEPIPSPDPVPPPNPGPDPPELTPVGSTPDGQQDPGEHGYGGTQQETNDSEGSIRSRTRTPTRTKTTISKRTSHVREIPVARRPLRSHWSRGR